MIVDSFPFLGQIRRFGHGVHDFPGELFPSELGIEGLDEPVRQGDPGSMNAVSTPAVSHHSISAAAVNSGPLSDRT